MKDLYDYIMKLHPSEDDIVTINHVRYRHGVLLSRLESLLDMSGDARTKAFDRIKTIGKVASRYRLMVIHLVLTTEQFIRSDN